MCSVSGREYLRQLDSDIAHYRSQAYAVTTKKAYQTHLRCYLRFCQATNLPPIPISDQNLCRYAAHLATWLQPVSVTKYLNILRILHRDMGLNNPLDNNWQLDIVLKGIKRDKGMAIKRKLPITPEILLAIRGCLHLYEPKDLLFWVACLLAFFGLLRKANLLPGSKATFDCNKHFLRGDLAKCASGLILRLKW